MNIVLFVVLSREQIDIMKNIHLKLLLEAKLNGAGVKGSKNGRFICSIIKCKLSNN